MFMRPMADFAVQTPRERTVSSGQSNAKGVMYACPATESGAWAFTGLPTMGLMPPWRCHHWPHGDNREILADNVSCSATYAAHVSLQNTGLLNLTLTARGVSSGGVPTEADQLVAQSCG